MTHPEELLAGYVDGSASGADRATVDVHLGTCARCRDEVEAASLARTALRELPEPDAPDLSVSVTAELGGAGAAVSSAPRWYRYAGLAAAALIAVAVVVSLPKVGSGPTADRQAAEAGGAAPTVGAAGSLAGLQLELLDADYDTAAVQSLAREVPRAASVEAGTATDDIGTAEQASRASACLATAFPGFTGTPARLISARFEGTPAYLAVVLEGPAPGQPADTASVWVADRATCQPLSFTSARI